MKVNKNHPKPLFLHTVSAESRCFESTFKKMIFIRDRLQKLRNLSLLQVFYSITFLVQKTLLSREKNCPGVQNGRFRTPRVAKVAVAAVPCVFSDAHVEITLFLSSGSLVKVHFGLPGASWRPLAPSGCLWRSPWRPLVLPGCPWRPLAALGAPWCPLAPPACPWRPLAAPGAPWCLLAAPGASPGCPWRSLAPPGVSWLALAPPAGPWRPLASPGAFWLPLAPPVGPWLPLAPPGCSWRSLVPPGAPWLPVAAPGAPWHSNFVVPTLRFRCGFTVDVYRIALFAAVLQWTSIELLFSLRFCSVGG